MWDEDRLQFVRGNSEKHGAADEILQHHNMTAEHAEILGQFLDMTGQTPERLKATLRTALARLDGDRRLFEVKMTHNGRTVTISYDPSDMEAVKAAETWRKALFAPKDAPKDGNCLYVSDRVRYALDAIAYLSGNIDGRYAFIPLTDKQREAIDALYEDLHSREPFDEANLFKPGSYEPKDLPTKHNRMTELEKAAGPLRTYLKIHGDPHTSVIVTQDGATETQDERRVTFRDCLNQAVCKAGERYDLKALKPQTSFSADAVQLNDKTGYFWESDNGVYTLRWREHPGEGAKRICKIHWDAVARSFFVTSLHDDGIRLIEDGFTTASTVPQAKTVAESMVESNLKGHFESRLSAWKPLNPRTIVEKPTIDNLRSQIIDLLPFEYISIWGRIAEEYGKLSSDQRECRDCVRIDDTFPEIVKSLSDRLLKDRDEAFKSDAEARRKQ